MRRMAWTLILAAGGALVSAPVVVARGEEKTKSEGYQKRDTWTETVVASRAALAADEKARMRLEDDFPLETDWAMQGFGYNLQQLLATRENADVERAAIGAVLEEPGAAAGPLQTELRQLQTAAVPAFDQRWLELYAKACRERRARRLAPLLERWPQIVFTKHFNLGGSHYAYTEAQSDAQAERNYRAGASLCVLDTASGAVRTLLDTREGVIRDPDVSFDGKRILFAWKKHDREDDFHLYEMAAATGETRQLTSGLGVADYEAAYLPDGDIIFTSSRCVQTVDCWWTEVSNLYRCESDGKNIRRLSFDQVHANYPTVTPDGRILYTRWEYNDRGQLYPQPLFQMNPDGTGQREYYGANSWFPTTILHARGIPGSQKVVSILSGHHSHQRGKLALIDLRRGQQEAAGVQLVAPVRETKAVKVDSYGQDGDQFQYPYPLSETEYLVTYTPHHANNRNYPRPYGIYWMDIDGRRELLASDPKIACNQSVPLAPRARPYQRASVVDYRQQTGVFYLQDVYAGPGLAGVPRGTIKKLRVIALEFRAAGVGSNNNGGPAGGALVSTPIALGNGSWDVKVVLGDAKVFADGSACFSVPARTPVYFQALDEKNRAVQTMRSWSTLQPGERFSCVGCHATKDETSATAAKPTLAMTAGPQKLDEFYGPARGFSFPKEIQPILDRNCISCHRDRNLPPPRDGAPKGAAGINPRLTLTALRLEDKWQFINQPPTADWNAKDFNPENWKSGKAGFGVKGAPIRVRTQWTNSDIWLRRTFDWPKQDRPKLQPMLQVQHDEAVEVYLNGVLALSHAKPESSSSWHPISAEAAATLQPRGNSVAVHCRQTEGGQHFDLALQGFPMVARATPVKPDDKVSFSLLSHPNHDQRAKRNWSDSYLALLQVGDQRDSYRAQPNELVNWIHAQSAPPMLPPYHAGATKSRLFDMLERGHNDVKLSREELDKIACWIDLLVPYCGDYVEANTWSEQDMAKHQRYQDKRDSYAREEREVIQALLAGP